MSYQIIHVSLTMNAAQTAWLRNHIALVKRADVQLQRRLWRFRSYRCICKRF